MVLLLFLVAAPNSPKLCASNYLSSPEANMLLSLPRDVLCAILEYVGTSSLRDLVNGSCLLGMCGVQYAKED